MGSSAMATAVNEGMYISAVVRKTTRQKLSDLFVLELFKCSSRSGQSTTASVDDRKSYFSITSVTQSERTANRTT